MAKTTSTFAKQQTSCSSKITTGEEEFLRDSKLFQSYKRTIHDYVTKDYAQRVSEKELGADGKPLGYLLHNTVFNPNRPRKPRVAFDCAARCKGSSFHDLLPSGPDLTNSLLSVLLRFRQEPVALSSDIEAMFHRVMVDPNDFDASRFLWWLGDDFSSLSFEYILYSLSSLSSLSVAYIFLVACLHQVVLVLVFERRLKTVQKTLPTKLSTQE